MAPVGGRHVRQRSDVFGKAATAEPQSGFEEGKPDTLVQPHTPRHLLDVGAKLVAYSRALADEAEARRQEGVGAVLDHLGGADIGDDDGTVEVGVELGDV